MNKLKRKFCYLCSLHPEITYSSVFSLVHILIIPSLLLGYFGIFFYVIAPAFEISPSRNLTLTVLLVFILLLCGTFKLTFKWCNTITNFLCIYNTNEPTWSIEYEEGESQPALCVLPNKSEENEKIISVKFPLS